MVYGSRSELNPVLKNEPNIQMGIILHISAHFEAADLISSPYVEMSFKAVCKYPQIVYKERANVARSEALYCFSRIFHIWHELDMPWI